MEGYGGVFYAGELTVSAFGAERRGRSLVSYRRATAAKALIIMKIATADSLIVLFLAIPISTILYTLIVISYHNQCKIARRLDVVPCTENAASHVM